MNGTSSKDDTLNDTLSETATLPEPEIAPEPIILNLTQILTSQNQKTPQHLLSEITNFLTKTSTTSEKLNRILVTSAEKLNIKSSSLTKEIEDDMTTISDKIQITNKTAYFVVQKLTEINNNLQKIQNKIESNLDDKIVEKIYENFDMMVSRFQDFSNFAVNASTHDLGNCNSLFETYKFTTDMVCDHIIDTLNGFWFTLGMCASLLPLNIIFGVKLAKFFRRMEIVDEYVDVLDHNHNKYRRNTPSTFQTATSYAHTSATEGEGTSYYSENYQEVMEE